MQLPPIQGYNLLRQPMRFPEQFTHSFNLVFIPFLRWHQDLVDSWVPFASELEQAISDFTFYEFPTLPRQTFLYRVFLNEGMRAGIPDPTTRARTITLYLDKAAFRQALGISHEKTIWLFLFDQQGHVLWRSQGGFDQKEADELARFLQAAERK